MNTYTQTFQLMKSTPLMWVIVLLLLIVACGPAPTPEANERGGAIPASPAESEPPTPENLSDGEEESSEQTATLAEENSEPAISADTETPEARGGPIGDEEAVQLMDDLIAPNGTLVNAAIDRILDESDQRFVSVFIELMRAAQIGLVPIPQDVAVFALERLSGQAFGTNWGGWIEWYGQTDLVPPPEFTTWKGNILAGIDPGFAEFLQSDFPSDIRVEEIAWGGVQVDGIPALDQSPMIPAADASYLAPEDAVFGLYINGDARAYPLRIMDWHEMANDIVGDVPVSIAYCTLCGAAVAYDGRASDGVTYDFGSSGFLFRSNKLMYDRQTRTLWNQLTGQPVLGELVGSGVTLDILPIVLTTWEEWQQLHPETIVLDINTGFNRPYDTGAAYGDYFSSDRTMFPVWQRSELLDTKDQIYALTFDGQPKAYPIDLLIEEVVVNDVHADRPVTLIAAGEKVTVDGNSRRAGPVTYSAGAAVRAYDRGDREFSPGSAPDMVRDQDGAEWEVTEDALIGPDGETAMRLGGHLAYWFGWYAFFPQTAVYGQ